MHEQTLHLADYLGILWCPSEQHSITFFCQVKQKNILIQVMVYLKGFVRWTAPLGKKNICIPVDIYICFFKLLKTKE